SRGHQAKNRWAEGGPRLSEQVQPSLARQDQRGKSPQSTAAGYPSAGSHASWEWPQGVVPQPGAHGIHRWHGGQGSAGAHRRADAARHEEKMRISPQVASWRLGDVGQPQRHAPGQPGLRYARAPLSLSPLAQGRDAGLTAATNNTPISTLLEDDHEPCISSDSNDRG